MFVENHVGKQIDEFTVQERIGRGGMSVVYRAFQRNMNRQVALKVISIDPTHSDRDDFRRRFAQEAELIARLEHIHILPIYDYGIAENEVAYIAMRLLRGGSLASVLSPEVPSLDRTADLFSQIARGLAYAHQRGVIHRDIKPSNILLDDSGNAYLTDFGLAKLIGDTVDITRSGNIVGTPAYMSPEQLRGDPTDHRSDIYSLGVVLFHMLTGRPPFDASDTNLISVIYQHLEKAPPRPSDWNTDVPPEVESVVMRALLKDPTDRYETADQMADALNLALGRRSTNSYPLVRPASSTQTVSSAAVPAPRSSRRRVVYPIIAGLVTLVIGILVVVSGARPIAPLPPPPTILAGEAGVAEDAVPSAVEISAAVAHAGADGFIGYIACNQSSEYHATQAREMGDFAAGYGLDYRVYDSQSDRSRQIPQIERARADGASLLIICPLDVELLDGVLTSAQDAGLPLVMMHGDMPSYGGVLIAGDDYLMGKSAGELAGNIIREEMDGEANVVILDYPDLDAIVQRANGIEDGILEAAPDATIVGRYLGGVQENGKASIEQLIEDNVDFDVIVSINDNGAFGAIAALEESGIDPDEIVITSVDAEALAREYIVDGHFMRGSVDVGRERFSRTAVDAAVKLLAGSTLPEILRVPPLGVLTRDDLMADDT